MDLVCHPCALAYYQAYTKHRSWSYEQLHSACPIWLHSTRQICLHLRLKPDRDLQHGRFTPDVGCSQTGAATNAHSRQGMVNFYLFSIYTHSNEICD